MSGYKTYLVAALVFAISAAHTSGWITDSAYQSLLGFLGAGGLAALRSAVATEAAKAH